MMGMSPLLNRTGIDVLMVLKSLVGMARTRGALGSASACLAIPCRK